MATVTKTRLTSTTAPNKVFTSREDLAQHYKSDWHRYNCKRKEAALPLLSEEDFNARLDAALAVRREREARDARDGTDHLKNKNKKNKKGAATKNGDLLQHEQEVDEVGDTNGRGDETDEKHQKHKHQQEEQLKESPPVIDPKQCLFDSTIHRTVLANVEYMKDKYSFFLPDPEYIVSIASLVGYCSEKINIGNICLYCQRGFRSCKAVKDHMVDARHCKIRYEEGVDLWEYEPFYDFTEANKEFLGEFGKTRTKGKRKKSSGLPSTPLADSYVVMEESSNDIDDDSEEWEDITSDDEGKNQKGRGEEDSDSGGLSAYEENLVEQGFDVTPLGELVFPDGRIVGHRALSCYYKQRFAPGSNERAAVVAAKRAVGERYLHQAARKDRDRAHANSKARALAFPGPVRAAERSTAHYGRQADGILVPNISSDGSGSSRGGFTTLSLYRYRAVQKKANRDEATARRLQQKSMTNINRMDKKANRLMNGVSVAHASR